MLLGAAKSLLARRGPASRALLLGGHGCAATAASTPPAPFFAAVRGLRTTPAVHGFANRTFEEHNLFHHPRIKWRREPEEGEVPGAPHTGERAAKRRPGEKSFNQKMDEARLARGLKPRRLIKTRKRIAHARHTHVARFRLRKGPAPRLVPEWDNPVEATRDAMIQFIDPYELDPELAPPGRQWHAAEARLKSNEDLQKLWVVLLRERNMLHTSRMHHRKQKTKMPHPDRLRSVRKSMAMVRVVLHEREQAKQARDQRLARELRREKALGQLQLEASAVWPPWLPGADRRLPLAQQLTFSVVLRTADGKPPLVRPEAEHLAVSLTLDGADEPIPTEKLHAHVVCRPPAPSRPDEIAYACHVMLSGDAVPRERFLASATKLRDEGAPLPAALSASLYGHELGNGAVPVLLTPSRRLKRRVKVAGINATMSEALRKAREEAAREAGIELPAPSPPPTPTEYWRPANPPLMR